MKKRKNKESETIRYIRKLRSILNKEYFHIYTEVKEKDRVEWKVYYKNLPTPAYWSNKNDELLTSKKHTIEDIYKLKKVFEQEKEKIYRDNLKEYLNVWSESYIQMCNIKRRYSTNITNLMFAIVAMNILNILFFDIREFGILQPVLIITLGTTDLLGAHKIEKEIDKVSEKTKERFIQDKIRRQGFYFVNKLKEQMQK
mgnify:CR=1 FL=1